MLDEESELELFESQLSKLYKQQNIESIKASPLKISIMSATASINTIINLKALAAQLHITDNIHHIDSMFNMTRRISNISKKKIFYNQLTVKIRPYYNKSYKININLVINIKLFRNGNLQMCGLRNENDGHLALQFLLKEINKIINIQKTHFRLLCTKYNHRIVKKIMNTLFDMHIYIIDYDTFIDTTKTIYNYNKLVYIKYKDILDKKVIKKLLNKTNRFIIVTKYNITLINSDFYVGFKINRNNTYDFILNEQNIICDYDPCIYQGVLIKFYWNYNKQIQNGKCMCDVPCNGKGSGNGNGQCKKLTISIFQSGNIIITGKCKRSEILYLYNFIVNLLHSNYDKLKKLLLLNEPTKIKRRNISILIQKNI